MCDRESQCTNLSEPSGPTDESFTYSVTESGQRALAATLLTDADRSARRRAFRRSLRQQGRRVGTVYTRFKDGRFVPEVRLCGAWLELVGFHLGRTFEIDVEPGMLSVRAVSAVNPSPGVQTPGYPRRVPPGRAERRPSERGAATERR